MFIVGGVWVLDLDYTHNKPPDYKYANFTTVQSIDLLQKLHGKARPAADPTPNIRGKLNLEALCIKFDYLLSPISYICSEEVCYESGDMP